MEEKRRIYRAGHTVENQRVDGGLALSRALGDFQYKQASNLNSELQAVTAKPDITVWERSTDDELIFIACDGIWDCKSNQ